jgi:hypothetical protein
MFPAIVVFLFVAGGIMGVYAAITYLPGVLAGRRLDQRLQEVSFGTAPVEPGSPDETVVKHAASGPLPGIDKSMSGTRGGSWLAKLIEQSGTRTTPSAVAIISLIAAIFGGLVTSLFVQQPGAAPLAALAFGYAPTGWLMHRRTKRVKRFEEQPGSAGPAVAPSVPGTRCNGHGHGRRRTASRSGEFKKTFDQQNYGLPLRDALTKWLSACRCSTCASRDRRPDSARHRWQLV